MANKTNQEDGMKFLLATKGGVEIVEHDSLDEAALSILGMKYPAGFISLTIMENIDGPY